MGFVSALICNFKKYVSVMCFEFTQLIQLHFLSVWPWCLHVTIFVIILLVCIIYSGLHHLL